MYDRELVVEIVRQIHKAANIMQNQNSPTGRNHADYSGRFAGSKELIAGCNLAIIAG